MRWLFSLMNPLTMASSSLGKVLLATLINVFYSRCATETTVRLIYDEFPTITPLITFAIPLVSSSFSRDGRSIRC